ncbi:hypothetical protein ACH5RR_008614 [Cinchona calisaya]|uniref:RNase H type-1 domain-containing protein n=1 Tax=Cinchona calisaya TaxID=153742 RepID=A0ABD3AFP1_9GENT
MTVAWTDPPLSMLKLNSDGSFVSEMGLASGASLVRTKTSSFVICFAYSFQHKSNLEAKALALIVGLESCLNNNLLEVLVESNSKILCQMVLGKYSIAWSLDPLIRKIHFLMS